MLFLIRPGQTDVLNSGFLPKLRGAPQVRNDGEAGPAEAPGCREGAAEARRARHVTAAAKALG